MRVEPNVEYYNYLRKKTKSRIKYNFPKLHYAIDHTYVGSPLILYNKSNNTGLLKSYDINSSYETTLLKDLFPLDSDYIVYKGAVKESPTKCYWYSVNVVLNGKKYDIEMCKLWLGHTLKYNFDKHCYEGYITKPGLETLKLLYDCEVNILHTLEFIHCGILPFKDIIDEAYNHLHTNYTSGTEEYKSIKAAIHKNFYGIMAWGNGYGKKVEFPKRKDECVIPIFQIDYRRLEMVKLFIKYIDDVVYIDTDSIFLRQNRKWEEPIGKEIGEWKEEMSGKTVDFFRFKTYIEYNEDGSIYKQVSSQYSGPQLTFEQINELKTNGILYTDYGRIKNEFGCFGFEHLINGGKEL